MGYTFVVLIALLVYRLGLYLYRYTLHPLAKFPGPRLAAVSSLYQIYYDVRMSSLVSIGLTAATDG